MTMQSRECHSRSASWPMVAQSQDYHRVGDPETGNNTQQDWTWPTCSSACSLTILATVIVAKCLSSAVDFFTDTTLALPAFWRANMLETFRVQILTITGCSLIAYVRFLYVQRAWSKLSKFPMWLRALFMIGGSLIFPLAPVFMIVQVFVGLIWRDAGIIEECESALRDVITGELPEALIGMTVQGAALFLHGFSLGAGLCVSFIIGLLTATEKVVGFDTAEHKLWSIPLSTSTEILEIVVVSGPLESRLASPWRTLLLFLLRLCELVSSIGGLILFHSYGPART